MNDFIVVKDHKDMLIYIDDLQRKNAEALSFYPKQVFEREIKNKRLFLGLLNNQPAGYLYMGALGGDVKLHQVCIEYDARRKLYGEMIVKAMEYECTETISNSITLRCGFDLDANKFWSSLGYKVIQIQDGGIRRNRKINVWRKYLLPQMFTHGWLEPVEGKTDASLWRKNKKTGLINGFARGKKMQQYRKIVEDGS
jgi:hypothetical protein